MELIYFLFSLLTRIALHLASSGYIDSPLLSFRFFTLYICNRILAAVVSNTTQAAETDPLLI